MKSFGIKGNLLKLLQSFLSSRVQRVVLNGQCSEWKNISAGVPQGSILGPLLFLIYINDLPDGLQSDVKMFADDTCLLSVIIDKNNLANDLNADPVQLHLSNIWGYKRNIRRKVVSRIRS